jgi:hypothetical protein
MIIGKRLLLLIGNIQVAIQINTQNLVPMTVDPPVQSSGRKGYSTQPSANPAFILSGPAPEEPEVYTPRAAGPSVADLLAMHQQQQTAADYIMGTIGDSHDLSGLRDPFATVADGEVPQFDDPKGAAIEYLTDAINNPGSAGDIFSVALSANGQGLEAATLAALATGTSSPDQLAGDVFAQMVHDVQQSNMATLLSLGGSSSTDRGLAELI